jgi:hypothetical protein
MTDPNQLPPPPKGYHYDPRVPQLPGQYVYRKHRVPSWLLFLVLLAVALAVVLVGMRMLANHVQEHPASLTTWLDVQVRPSLS